jgi:hypothetical protein
MNATRRSVTRALRADFTAKTNLTTFTGPPEWQWIGGELTFDADAPRPGTEERAVEAWLAEAERIGFTPEFAIRNSRMSITLTLKESK